MHARSRTTILLALLLGTAQAQASTANGYICSAVHDPSSGSLGNAGYIYASVFSGPSCTGSQVASGYFCSTGATSSTCGRIYSEASLLHLMDRMQAAAAVNQRVAVSIDSMLRLMYVFFRAD